MEHLLIILSIFLLFSFIFISCSNTNNTMSTGNTTTSPWTKQLGTSADDSGTDVTTDSSDNIYVTGITGGGLDGNTTSGGTDIFLVKYNSPGTK